MAAKGKYREWLSEDSLTKLEAWARDGLTDEQIAHNMGISRATLYEYKKNYPEISDALKRGKEVVDILVENALLKRALGYEYQETVEEIFETPDIVDVNGKPRQRKHIKRVTKVALPDTTAMIFWLKNRRPDVWRDKHEIVDTAALDKLDEILEANHEIAIQRQAE